MESVDGLVALLAAVLAKQKFLEIVEPVCGFAPEFKVLRILCEARSTFTPA